MKRLMKKKKTILLVLLILVIGGWRICGASQNEQDKADTAMTGSALLAVTVVPVESRIFEDSFVVQGNLEAVNYALVPARIGGTIDVLWADEGSVVSAGDKLAQTDPVKLQQAVAISERELEVAEFSRREKEAALEQTRAQFDKALLDYERYKKLRDKEVVTQDEYEQRESAWKQQKALCDHSQALLDLSAAQEKLAAVALEMSKKDLQDTYVTAPIDGVISERLRELGEMAAPGAPVFRMVDKNVVEASAFVPAEYYESFAPGKAKVRLSANGKELGEFPVSYRSAEIDNRLRTFEIKARLDNPDGNLAPGNMIQVQGVMSQKNGMGVPRNAVIARGAGDVVFVVRDGAARLVPVKKGLVTGGWIEVESADLEDGERVVTVGQTMLNDGDMVMVKD